MAACSTSRWRSSCRATSWRAIRSASRWPRPADMTCCQGAGHAGSWPRMGTPGGRSRRRVAPSSMVVRRDARRPASHAPTSCSSITRRRSVLAPCRAMSSCAYARAWTRPSTNDPTPCRTRASAAAVPWSCDTAWAPAVGDRRHRTTGAGRPARMYSVASAASTAGRSAGPVARARASQASRALAMRARWPRGIRWAVGEPATWLRPVPDRGTAFSPGPCGAAGATRERARTRSGARPGRGRVQDRWLRAPGGSGSWGPRCAGSAASDHPPA